MNYQENNEDKWSRDPGENLLSPADWERIAGSTRLTVREVEVCRELFTQKTREEIASQLGIKPRTVRHHLEMIHSKLKVNSRVGVVLRIISIRNHLDSVRGEQVRAEDQISEVVRLHPPEPPSRAEHALVSGGGSIEAN